MSEPVPVPMKSLSSMIKSAPISRADINASSYPLSINQNSEGARCMNHHLRILKFGIVDGMNIIYSSFHLDSCISLPRSFFLSSSSSIEDLISLNVISEAHFEHCASATLIYTGGVHKKENPILRVASGVVRCSLSANPIYTIISGVATHNFLYFNPFHFFYIQINEGGSIPLLWIYSYNNVMVNPSSLFNGNLSLDTLHPLLLFSLQLYSSTLYVPHFEARSINKSAFTLPVIYFIFIYRIRKVISLLSYLCLYDRLIIIIVNIISALAANTYNYVKNRKRTNHKGGN